jgi:lipoyl-dependent peroxiredoxin subunit D
MSEAVTSVDSLIERLPDYAKDIRLNLGTVLTSEGAPDLTETQIAGIALSVAYATRNGAVIGAIENFAQGKLDAAGQQAAKAAATIMAMNNVYYRFTHTMHDDELSKMPAQLRMTVIGKPGVTKIDFELMSLAVSMINNCAMCMQAHVHEVTKQGISKTGIQSVARIAAVIAAAAQAMVILATSTLDVEAKSAA